MTCAMIARVITFLRLIDSLAPNTLFNHLFVSRRRSSESNGAQKPRRDDDDVVVAPIKTSVNDAIRVIKSVTGARRRQYSRTASK